jgi:hypothetical protein
MKITVEKAYPASHDANQENNPTAASKVQLASRLHVLQPE